MPNQLSELRKKYRNIVKNFKDKITNEEDIERAASL